MKKLLLILLILFATPAFACDHIRIVHSGDDVTGAEIPEALLPLTYTLYDNNEVYALPDGIVLEGVFNEGVIGPVEVSCADLGFAPGTHSLAVTTTDQAGVVSAISDAIETTVYSGAAPARAILQVIEIGIQ